MKGACRPSVGSEREERGCGCGGGRGSEVGRVRRDSVNFVLSRSSTRDAIGHNACKLGFTFWVRLGVPNMLYYCINTLN